MCWWCVSWFLLCQMWSKGHLRTSRKMLRSWCPTTWQIIQSMIDNNIQQQTEMHYDRLNKKLDCLLQKQPKHSTPLRQDENHHNFYTRVKNLTNINLNAEEMWLLKYCLNYSTERPASSYAANLIPETEQAIRLLDVKLQNTYRFMATEKLKQIISSTSRTNVLQKKDNCMWWKNWIKSWLQKMQ